MGIFNSSLSRVGLGAGVGALAGAGLDSNNRGAGALMGAAAGGLGTGGVMSLMRRRSAAASAAKAVDVMAGHTMAEGAVDESYRRAQGMALKMRMRQQRKGTFVSSGFNNFWKGR